MNQELNILKDYLKQQGLRLTPQREAILNAFIENEGHLEIEELFKLAKAKDASIGIATVYRTVNILTTCGLARVNSLPNGKRFYERLYRQGHHDHLVCNTCGKIVEFEHPLIEQFQEEIAIDHNFMLQNHQMSLYGTCSSCKS
mgnify:CR=1 FL=1